jgi:hypothetical protein
MQSEYVLIIYVVLNAMIFFVISEMLYKSQEILLLASELPGKTWKLSFFIGKTATICFNIMDK